MTSGKSIDPAALVAVVADLENRVEGVGDCVSIAVETDSDEAFFIGTRSGYVRLAVALLRAAASAAVRQFFAPRVVDLV